MAFNWFLLLQISKERGKGTKVFFQKPIGRQNWKRPFIDCEKKKEMKGFLRMEKETFCVVAAVLAFVAFEFFSYNDCGEQNSSIERNFE